MEKLLRLPSARGRSNGLVGEFQGPEYSFTGMLQRVSHPIISFGKYETLHQYLSTLPTGAILSKYVQLHSPSGEKELPVTASQQPRGSPSNLLVAPVSGNISNTSWDEVIRTVENILCPFCVT